jgi:RNA polymerase sigma factor (TIGR02999 family)
MAQFLGLMEKSEFTLLLRKWSGGKKAVLDQIAPAIYEELRKLASARLRREREGHTLQPTALINEAYLRLVDHDQKEWYSRAHFFSVAGRIMRQILVDHARARRAGKRGGRDVKVTWSDGVSFTPERGATLIALDDGLRELASFDERKSRLIELKYFGGLQTEEIAEAIGLSRSTVTREARLAEAWLHNYLTGKS